MAVPGTEPDQVVTGAGEISAVFRSKLLAGGADLAPHSSLLTASAETSGRMRLTDLLACALCLSVNLFIEARAWLF